MVLREKEARKLIRNIRKMKIKELNVELELYYVECCLEVIDDFGYWDERYYIALENIFHDAANEIAELGMENKYKKQMYTIANKASEFGIELFY